MTHWGRGILAAALAVCWIAHAHTACVEPRHESLNDIATFFAVPEVTGMPEEDAVICLKKYGFATRRGGVEESNLPAGLVTRTDPAADSLFRAREVMVTYWRASGANVVPPVVGQGHDEAARTIQAAGFTLGEHLTRPDGAPSGQVVAQAPEPGVVQRLGAPISIVSAVALPEAPPPPPPPPIVDSDAGSSPPAQANESKPSDAADAPQGADTGAPANDGGQDVPMDESEGEPFDDAGNGTPVVETQPPPSRVDPGNGIPPPPPPPQTTVEVPYLIALTASEAVRRIEAVGLVAVHGGYRYGLRGDGLVLSQSPNGGELASAGGTVRFVVVSARPVQAAIAAVVAVLLLSTVWWTRWRPWPFHWPPAVVVRGRFDMAGPEGLHAPDPVASAPSVTVGSRLDEGELRFSEMVVTHVEDRDD